MRRYTIFTILCTCKSRMSFCPLSGKAKTRTHADFITVSLSTENVSGSRITNIQKCRSSSFCVVVVCCYICMAVYRPPNCFLGCQRSVGFTGYAHCWSCLCQGVLIFDVIIASDVIMHGPETFNFRSCCVAMTQRTAMREEAIALLLQ